MSPSLITGEGSEGRGGIEGGKDSSALPFDALLSSLVWVDGEKGRDASNATAGRLIETDAGGFVALFVGRAGGFVLFVGGGGSGVALFDGGGGGFVVAAG